MTDEDRELNRFLNNLVVVEAADVGPDRRQGRAPIVLTMSEVVAEEVQWLMRGFIPAGKVCILDGDPQVGKSSICLDLAARLTTGRQFPGETTAHPTAAVLLLTAEDGLADTIRPRLEAARADLTKVHVLKGVEHELGAEGAPPTFPTDFGALRDSITGFGVRLVVIDPIMAYIGAGVDAYRDSQVRSVMAPLAEIAEATGAAIVGIRHLNKGQGSRAMYRGGGSIAFTAAARSAMLAARDPADASRFVLASTKCNLSARPESLAYALQEANGSVVVEWLGKVAYTADELLPNERSATGQGEALAFLRSALEGGERPVGELEAKAEDLGISKRTLRRARQTLGLVTVREGFSGSCSWSLPLEREGVEGD